jgi:phosphoglycerol transferase MdoB-like AlkP superfamily enzyme
MLFPVLVILSLLFVRPGVTHRIIKVYTVFLLAVSSFLAVSDLALYGEWGFRLDMTPLLYLSSPKEAFASVSLLFILNHLLIAAALVTLFVYIFTISFKQESLETKASWWSFSSVLVFLVVLFLPIRGGLGVTAINLSSAYFSQNTFANHAAINLPWNLGYSLTNLELIDNPFIFFDTEDAEKLTSAFTDHGKSGRKAVKNPRPNIILVILESFSANATGCLNGTIPVTPNLDSFARQGILFSRIYASGDRTDKGMLAIFSGYPSQPTTSIIKFPNKTQSLPALPETLHKNGYNTYFYYGGDIDFANYKSYLMNAGFEHLISLKDFPSGTHISNWGVPDEYLFDKAFRDIDSLKRPYFLSLFTLSSHPPYDIPGEPFLDGESDEIRYCNSVHYTDLFLGKFLRDLESGNKLDNTLVILIADHGCIWPGNVNYNSPAKYHIPMIWYGGALKDRNLVISSIGNQTDLAATLLGQLDIRSDEFSFSRNIFADAPSRQTVYAIHNGFGFVSDSLEFCYYRNADNTVTTKGQLSDSSLTEAKAFYQILYDDLLNR